MFGEIIEGIDNRLTGVGEVGTFGGVGTGSVF